MKYAVVQLVGFIALVERVAASDQEGGDASWVCAMTAWSVTSVPPWPSLDKAKLEAMYWPISAMFAIFPVWSSTVRMPPVLLAV
jgi:hypothetical protein